jgi:phosphohistidine phosphatase
MRGRTRKFVEYRYMKDLVLLRHGHALSVREANVPSDSLRPLSETGEKEVLEAAARLKAQGFSPALIICSPFRRAVRTAELAASIWPSSELETSDALSDGPVQDIVDLITPSGPASVLLVGHQPLLGVAAGFFAGGAPLSLSPAGYARVNTDPASGGGSLLELYDPAEPQEKPR